MLKDLIQQPCLAQRDYCLRCRRAQVTCLCDSIGSLDTRSRVVILMHPMEYKKVKHGTGRMTHLSLTNSEILIDVDFTEHPRVNELIADPERDVRLLYPGTDALNLSQQRYVAAPGKELTLLLIDATWPCAKKVMRLSQNLQRLPRLSLDVKHPSEFAIKHQPHEYCLSTVEATQRVLSLLANSGHEPDFDASAREQLLRPFHEMIAKQQYFASRPDLNRYRASAGYRSPEERTPSLKHAQRSIVFQVR